jgi:hypothetical protein
VNRPKGTPTLQGGEEVRYAKCSVIKFRGGTVVLYPLAKYQPEVKPLYGKRVHVVIIAED